MLSRVMISGRARPKVLHRGAMEKLTGLGVWPEVIIDQHFMERKRNNRLLTAVLDHPQLLGVGIGEHAGVVAHGSSLEVIGSGQVIIYDARGAKVAPTDTGKAQAVTGVTLHVLRPGMRFSLGR